MSESKEKEQKYMEFAKKIDNLSMECLAYSDTKRKELLLEMRELGIYVNIEAHFVRYLILNSLHSLFNIIKIMNDENNEGNLDRLKEYFKSILDQTNRDVKSTHDINYKVFIADNEPTNNVLDFAAKKKERCKDCNCEDKEDV